MKKLTLALALALALAPATVSAYDEHKEWEADLVHWANSKTVGEMEEVKGIGPITAARIIAARPHASIKTIDEVKGIGPKTIHKILAWIIRQEEREES